MVLEYSSFSHCGTFYAHCGSDGKLKIWESGSGTLKQEYTPNLHLTSPYTCLTWISSTNVTSHQKKKRKSDGEGGSAMVVLGMQSGGIVVYSIAEGSLVSTLKDGHKSPVLCLAWQRHADLFTCTPDNFVHWDVKNKTVRRKWKNGETCTAMAVSEDGEILVTASHGIKWWNVADKTVVKTFTGHATSIVHLAFLTSSSGDNYVVSAAQNDRLLNTWCLNTTSDSHAVSSFLMSDIAHSVSVNVSQDGSANLAVVTQSGTLHFYSQQLNGKCGKPLKPKLTMMIASDTGQSKAKVSPLKIVAAHLLANLRAHIVYGQPPFLAFETIKLEHTSKELCLVRKDPKTTLANNQESVTKVRQPEVSKDVQYMSTASAMVNGSSAVKRGRSKESEVPMEERLENLALNQPSASATQPKGEGMAHLLLQGLQSKDKNLLQSVLFKRDESVIAQTVQRLPVQVINPLVKELTSLMQGKTFTTQVAVLWLKALLAAHASQLLADPDTTAMLTPLLSLVEARLGCLAPLARLRGRLDLMLHQMSGAEATTSLDSQALVVHQDQDSTEEGSDTFGSDAEDDESEDKWDELSDEEVENMESEDVELSS